MYSMSNIPCLRKMGNVDKINNRPLLGYMSVCSDFAVKPSPIKSIFCFGVPNLFLGASQFLTYSEIPLQITGLFIFIHVQNLYLSHPLLLWQRIRLYQIHLNWSTMSPNWATTVEGFTTKGSFPAMRKGGENTLTACLMGYWKYSFVESELFTRTNCCEKRHWQPLPIKG